MLRYIYVDMEKTLIFIRNCYSIRNLQTREQWFAESEV